VAVRLRVGVLLVVRFHRSSPHGFYEHRPGLVAFVGCASVARWLSPSRSQAQRSPVGRAVPGVDYPAPKAISSSRLSNPRRCILYQAARTQLQRLRLMKALERLAPQSRQVHRPLAAFRG